MLLARRFLRKLSWDGLFRISSSHNFVMCFADSGMNANFNETSVEKHSEINFES